MHRKVSGRCTSITFDGHTSDPRTLTRGLDQGCPLSGIAFQFYNADLIDICDKKTGKDAVAFVDDTLLLARGKNLETTNNKVIDMMERAGGTFTWSKTHQCEFTIEKFSIMGLTRRREKNPMGRPVTRPIERKPIQILQTTVPVIAEHKFLGVILDQELRWNAHVNYALAKGTKWITQYRRLAKQMKGISAKHMRKFYITTAIPRMLYAADLFLTPQSGQAIGSKGHIKRLGRIQRQATIHTTGALRSTPTDSLDAHADLLPFQYLVEKLLYRVTT